MATSQVDDDGAGRLILTNATPYVWKRSLKKPKGMKLWTFGERIEPGESSVVQIAFEGGDGAHGQASYQVRRGSHCILVTTEFVARSCLSSTLTHSLMAVKADG